MLLKLLLAKKLREEVELKKPTNAPKLTTPSREYIKEKSEE